MFFEIFERNKVNVETAKSIFRAQLATASLVFRCFVESKVNNKMRIK